MGLSTSVRVGSTQWAGAGYRPAAVGPFAYTGFTSPSQFADGTGLSISDGDTVIGYRFQGSFCAASDVTFLGCLIMGASPNDRLTGDNGTDVTYDYCGWQGATSSGLFADDYQFAISDFGSGLSPGLTVKNSYARDFGNAFITAGDYSANPQTYQDMLIYLSCLDNDPSTGNPYHNDGIGNPDNGSTTKGINCDHIVIASKGNTNAIAYQNGIYDKINVTNSVMAGFGYAVAFAATGGTATNTGFTDNEYWTLFKPQSGSVGAGGGPCYPQLDWAKTANGGNWARNKWITQLDAGRAAQFPWAGAFEWGTSAYNGMFWIPNGTDATSNGWDDTPFVSSSDYNGL